MSPPQEGSAPPWLVLFHQIPLKPDYLRVKVRRRLLRMGAVALKNSVYVLPRSDDGLEDFQWLRREIVADGGDAMICEAGFVAGVTDGELLSLFAAQRAAAAPQPPATAPDRVTPGSTWVTREHLFVDRIASAWLIRRFVDPGARFKFVPPQRYRPEPGELRFDMFEAEYTHDGERCTFETLLARLALRDPALQAIAEIVHDIDCKDGKFARAEAPGIATLLQGIAAAAPDDAARLARGAVLFDDLYARFSEPTV